MPGHSALANLSHLAGMLIAVELRLSELIQNAPWREAVTYRDTWPHEYVLSERDDQRELLAAICARFHAGEGVAGRFFRMTNTYLFVGDIYWAHGQPGGWMDGKGLSVTNSSDGHGRYFRFPKMQEAQWIGISYPQWAAHGEIPIWSRIWDSALVDLHALHQQLDASAELVPGGSLWVPILLRTGVMYEHVLDDAVRQVEAVRDAIRQVSDAAAGQA